MRLETRFVQVPNDPQTINAVNNLAAVWGWSVQSIQVTDSKVTYEGDSYGWVSEYGASITREIITEHTNYASITYQRDMDDDKYGQWCEHERKYNACDDKSYLTEEEEGRYAEAKLRDQEEAKKRRKKHRNIAYIVGALLIPTGFGVAIIIGAKVYFAFKEPKVYDCGDVRQLDRINEERRQQHKLEILEQAKLV